MQQDKEKISVCFVMPKAYPLFDPAVDSVFGGAEVDLYYLSTELAKDKDFNVSFITADYGQNDVETIEDVTVIKSLNFRQNVLAGAVKIWCAMKKADAEIYMLKTASPGVPLAKIFCSVYKRAFAYRAASSRECDGTYIGKNKILGRFFKWALRHADFVTVQNSEDMENLNRTISVRSKVIPNGHRLNDFDNTRCDYVLWVGRSAKVKRPELFVELAKKCPDEKFVMICQQATGDDSYGELVKAAVAVENLEFHQRVDFRRIDEYFAKAKAFVNTSNSEGFPNTFIQAAKASVPILSLNVNPDGFLDKYACGICCDGDIDKMAARLKTIISTPEGAEIGENARKYVEQAHDISKIIKQYKQFFIRLMQEKGGN